MIRLRTLLFVVLVVAVGSVGLLSGKVAPTTIKELADSSDYIVIGTVTSVVELREVPVATLLVSSVIKGPPVTKVVFLARGTWTCDISGAEEGEEVLLFLSPYEFASNPHPQVESEREVWTTEFEEPAGFREEVEALLDELPFLQIAWAGRGSMPIRKRKGEQYVTIWTDDVSLPEGVQTIDGPEKKYADFIRSVKLDQILGILEEWQLQPEQ